MLGCSIFAPGHWAAVGQSVDKQIKTARGDYQNIRLKLRTWLISAFFMSAPLNTYYKLIKQIVFSVIIINQNSYPEPQCPDNLLLAPLTGASVYGGDWSLVPSVWWGRSSVLAALQCIISGQHPGGRSWSDWSGGNRYFYNKQQRKGDW